MTSPVPGSQSGVFSPMTTQMSRQVERAASKSFAGKNSKYKLLANNNGISFLPIIFESTGRIEAHAAKFLKRCAEHTAEVKKINPGIVYGYMLNRLSCVTQHCIATAINSRAHILTGHATRAASRAHIVSDEHVLNHQRVHITADNGRRRR